MGEAMIASIPVADGCAAAAVAVVTDMWEPRKAIENKRGILALRGDEIHLARQMVVLGPFSKA